MLALPKTKGDRPSVEIHRATECFGIALLTACPNAQDALPLSESPYLMHPVETKNVGLYQSPVAILDFASLYPSLYRAYNLCYTTLLHPDDSNAFPPEQVTVTPTGSFPLPLSNSCFA